MADWSDLPLDLLGLILKRLDRFDTIRCGSVSQSWFTAQQECARPLKLPWLILGDDDHSTRSRGIFSLSDQKTDRLVFPELLGKRCCGSSRGWLFTIDLELTLRLMHPFTRCQIVLPCLPPYSEDFSPSSQEDYEVFQKMYIQKGILSCDPIKNRDECVAMIIYGGTRNLAYCKIGDNNWKMLPKFAVCYSDVIFYRKQFYAVDARGHTVLCDVGPKQRVKKCAPRCDGNLSDHHYLVEFNGDLLHVERHISFYEDIWYMEYDNEVMYKRCRFFDGRDLEDRPDHSPLYNEDIEVRSFTYDFDVFKLDTIKKKWEKVESLGDHAIFLGSNNSTCIIASEYPECKANHIYFTDSYFDRGPEYGYEDNGMYHLEDETVEPVFSTEFFHPILSPPIWLFPR